MNESETKLLAVGFDPAEVAALKRLQRELEAAGYRVAELGFFGRKTPVAVVAKREDGKAPIRTFIAACRSLLRAAEEIKDGEAISPEEQETIAAVRLTARVAAGRLIVRRMKTIGGEAHHQMAEAVNRVEEVLDGD